ncbi:hypothetical protein BH23ACI1_BH23ACI1_27240 [soil metagenome]
MFEVDDKRQGVDRRRHPRGGRRITELDGAAPLVMVVDRDPTRRDIAHAILSKLKFAVAPVESVERAVEIAHTLNAEVIVVDEADAARLSAALAHESAIPVVAVGKDGRPADELIEAVRRALRQAS